MSMDRFFLANAAEDYKIEIPDYLAEAKGFLAAATKYRTDLEALGAPTLAGVNAKTIVKTIDAVLAFAQRGDRLVLAAQVEHIADGLLEDAYARFKQVLLIELAAPFDKAAAEFMAVYDRTPDARQDPATLATLGELVRLRDLLAPGRVGDATPANSGLDLPTRCATLPSKEVILVRLPGRTHGLQRGSLEWCNAMLSVDGVRLKWHTPAQHAPTRTPCLSPSPPPDPPMTRCRALCWDGHGSDTTDRGTRPMDRGHADG